MCLLSAALSRRRLCRRRFRTRLLLVLTFLVISLSLVSISSLTGSPRHYRFSAFSSTAGDNNNRQSIQPPNLFLNYQKYFDYLREKYPNAQKSESFCQNTDLFAQLTEKQEDATRLSSSSSSSNSDRLHPACNSTTSEWVRFDRFGRMSFDDSITSRRQRQQVEFCEYADVKWSGNDYGFELGEFVRIDEGERVRNGTEFFHVRCMSKSGLVVYESAFARLFDEQIR